MRNKILAIFLILAVILAAGIFAARKGAEDADTGSEKLKKELGLENPDLENPIYENEQEGVEVTEKSAPQDSFYGSWEAASDRAEYLYGNIDLSIADDGTWKGNFTDEKYNGTWKYNGTGITLSSELINCDLFFSDDGSLMFRDHDSPEDLLVLTPVR